MAFLPYYTIRRRILYLIYITTCIFIIYFRCLKLLKAEFKRDLSLKHGLKALKYLSNDWEKKNPAEVHKMSLATHIHDQRLDDKVICMERLFKVETDIATSITTVYQYLLKLNVIVFMRYVILCLTSRWSVIFCIRISLLNLTISFQGDQRKNG